MSRLVFVTTNENKFITADHTCRRYGIGLTQKKVTLDEIQSERPLSVALDKAKKAFERLQVPLIVTDDSWQILGLGGFPGVYMHAINNWFSPEDFLHLTRPLQDRRITQTIYLIYIDSHGHKVFRQRLTGHLLTEARGESRYSSHRIMAFDTDKGKSIAEAFSDATDKSSRGSAAIWHRFAEWYAS